MRRFSKLVLQKDLLKTKLQDREYIHLYSRSNMKGCLGCLRYIICVHIVSIPIISITYRRKRRKNEEIKKSACLSCGRSYDSGYCEWGIRRYDICEGEEQGQGCSC